MAPLSCASEELDPKHTELLVKFVSDVRTKKIDGSENRALSAITLLEQIINDSNNDSAFVVCGRVREAGRVLGRALPLCPEPVNMARRVLRALRDDHRAHSDQSYEGGSSLQRLVRGAARRDTLPAAAPPAAAALREHLQELRLEVEGSAESVCAAGKELAQYEESVLCVAPSRLSARLLRKAHARALLVPATRPEETEAVAAKLAASGVPVTLVGDAAVAAIMSRVNKVVVEVVAVVSGGAAWAPAGSLAVTAAARLHAVPVLALAPLHVLCPLQASEPPLAANQEPYRRADSAGLCAPAPLYDLIPPDHVTLYVTNHGGNSPSYIYRLLSELYDPSDYQL